MWVESHIYSWTGTFLTEGRSGWGLGKTLNHPGQWDWLREIEGQKDKVLKLFRRKRNELLRLGSWENERSGNKEIGEVRKRCYSYQCEEQSTEKLGKIVRIQILVHILYFYKWNVAIDLDILAFLKGGFSCITGVDKRQLDNILCPRHWLGSISMIIKVAFIELWLCARYFSKSSTCIIL